MTRLNIITATKEQPITCCLFSDQKLLLAVLGDLQAFKKRQVLFYVHTYDAPKDIFQKYIENQI